MVRGNHTNLYCSGDFDEESGQSLESVTYWDYKTIHTLYRELEKAKGTDYTVLVTTFVSRSSFSRS